jgi:hypothetical protein
MKNKETIVYYSPYPIDFHQNWDILYQPPEKVFDFLKTKKTDTDFSYLECPSVNGVQKKMFRLVNTLTSEYEIKENEVTPVSKNYIAINNVRERTLKNQNMFSLSLFWIFFTEDDSLEMTIMPPIMEKAKHLQYGACITGTMDIGKYFRMLTVEYNLWEDVKTFKIEKDEPLAYLWFNTKNVVNLKRFTMNETLYKYAETIKKSSEWESRVPLISRYDRFSKSGIKPIILREIKNNVSE